MSHALSVLEPVTFGEDYEPPVEDPLPFSATREADCTSRVSAAGLPAQDFSVRSVHTCIITDMIQIVGSYHRCGVDLFI